MQIKAAKGPLLFLNKVGYNSTTALYVFWESWHAIDSISNKKIFGLYQGRKQYYL